MLVTGNLEFAKVKIKYKNNINTKIQHYPECLLNWTTTNIDSLYKVEVFTFSCDEFYQYTMPVKADRYYEVEWAKVKLKFKDNLIKIIKVPVCSLYFQAITQMVCPAAGPKKFITNQFRFEF